MDGFVIKELANILEEAERGGADLDYLRSLLRASPKNSKMPSTSREWEQWLRDEKARTETMSQAERRDAMIAERERDAAVADLVKRVAELESRQF